MCLIHKRVMYQKSKINVKKVESIFRSEIQLLEKIEVSMFEIYLNKSKFL